MNLDGGNLIFTSRLSDGQSEYLRLWLRVVKACMGKISSYLTTTSTKAMYNGIYSIGQPQTTSENTTSCPSVVIGGSTSVNGNSYSNSKVCGANMGPNWVLSAPDGPHVDPMNLAIRVSMSVPYVKNQCQEGSYQINHDPFTDW